MTAGSANKAAHTTTNPRRYHRLLAAVVSTLGLVHLVFAPFGSSEADSTWKVDVRKSLTGEKQWRIPKLTLHDQASKETDDWCTEEEYLDGEWVKREEEVTTNNIRRIFQYTVSRRTVCSDVACNQGSLTCALSLSRIEAHSNVLLKMSPTAWTLKTVIPLCSKDSWKRHNMSINLEAGAVSIHGTGGTLRNSV